MTKPRIIFAHCWGGNPEYAFYPDSRRQLEQAGFPVDIPAMPDTDEPKLQPWVETLEAALAPRFEGERRIVVAHSLGVITTMRCLERGAAIDGLVVIAGNTSDVGFHDELGEFFEQPIEYGAVKRGIATAPELFYSNDDPYVPVAEGQALGHALGAHITVMEGMKHFSGPVGEVGSCERLPEAVEAVRRIAQAIGESTN